MTLETWIHAAGIVAGSLVGAYVITHLLEWAFGE